MAAATGAAGLALILATGVIWKRTRSLEGDTLARSTTRDGTAPVQEHQSTPESVGADPAGAPSTGAANAVSSSTPSGQEPSTAVERLGLALAAHETPTIYRSVQGLLGKKTRQEGLSKVLVKLLGEEKYVLVHGDALKLLGIQADEAAKEYFTQRVKAEYADAEFRGHPHTIGGLQALAENDGIKAGSPLADDLLRLIKDPQAVTVDSLVSVVAMNKDAKLIREVETYYLAATPEGDGGEAVKKIGIGAGLIASDPTFLARSCQQYAGMDPSAQATLLTSLWRVSGPSADAVEKAVVAQTIEAAQLVSLGMASPNPTVRLEACRAVGKLPFLCVGNVKQELSRLAASDSDPRVRKGASKALEAR